jgi:DNA polymerase-1
MLLQVHDELVFEVPEKDAGKTAKLVADVMSRAAEPVVKIAVPLVVETGTGKTWNEAH